MPNLVYHEDIVTVQAVPTLLAPSDYQRTYLAVQVSAITSSVLISTLASNLAAAPQALGGVLPSGSLNSGTSVDTWASLELWADRHGPLVWQEWWAVITAGGPVSVVVWTVRDISVPKPRQTPGGIMLPGRNGYQSGDGLDGVDRVAMDTTLNQMRLATRRVANARA